MVLKFCANISFMFTESGSLIERYGLARAAGFHGVESAFPTGFTLEEVLSAKNATGIKQVLLNTCNEHVTGGEFGVAAMVGQSEQFRKNFQTTIEYAKAMKCGKIHIMAGKFTNELTEDHFTTYVDNLRYCAKELHKHDIIGLIEPINKYALPGYYLNNYETALSVINAVNEPNIRLLLDLYHCQHIRGNISHTIKDLMPYIGHVQIAQVPHRNEPNTAGEINYPYVLELLSETGYDDWIGLEYHPKSFTVDGLNWIKEFGYSLAVH